MESLLLPFLYLLVPFGFLSFGIIHQGQHFALLCAAVAGMALLIKNRWIQAFTGYVVLWQIVIFITVMKFNLNPELIGASLYFLFFFMAALVLYKAASTSKATLETWSNVICVSSLIQVLISLCQFFTGIDPVLVAIRCFVPATPLLSTDTVTGSLGNPNFVAAYLAISLPFFFRKYWNFCLVPLALVLIVSKSSSAVVPAIIGTIFYFGGLRWVFFSIIPAGAYLLYDNALHQLVDKMPESRGGIWLEAWKQIIYSKISFIFGYGNGAGYGRPYPMHNEWLQCLHQYGVIGLSLLTGYVVTIYRGNRTLFTAFVIAAINMFGNYPLHLAPSAFLIILIAGLIEREKGNDGKE